MPSAAESTAAEAAAAKLITVIMNGQEIQTLPGRTILQVARDAGIDIPTLCHDPRLDPYGACRMCLVEVEGARGPMPACGAVVREGMSIQTHTEKICKLRKFVLELLLTNHPLDCPVCEASGDCRLQDYAYEYQVDMVPWGWRAPAAGGPGEHPNIAHFGARCVLCGRCVRICREVMDIGCWGYLNRGFDSEVDTPYRLPLQEVKCVSCGQCVSTCPVGAIVGQRTPQGARGWQTTKTVTTCSYCGDGCRLVLHSYRGKVVRVASELEKGLNQGSLCIKGRFGWGYVNAPDRLTNPLVRNAAGVLKETSWEEALRLVAQKIEAARTAKGGSAIAAICGTHCTNEAGYLVQKLMRTVAGSNNVDAIDHAEQKSSEVALTAAFGLAAATNSRKDLGAADVILVMGTNLTESDPVFGLEIIKALRRGKTVIVVDPRTTDLATEATYHLPVKPGTDLAALRGLMRHILDLGLQDVEFIKERTEGFTAFEGSLAGVDVKTEAATCGVNPDLLRAAAAAFGQAGAAAIIYGAGVTQGPVGAATVAAIAGLAMLTGNVGRPGTGVFPLHSGANSQGLADMGVRPACLPGGVSMSDTKQVARVEAAWGASLAGMARGVSLDEMISDMQSGDIRVLYVVGADPAMALPDEMRVRRALEKVDFLVVEDSFPTDTTEYADVILPAAAALEDEGTFTNAERFVQRVRAAVPVLGQSLADWKIVQQLANAMGAHWAYASPADVMGEIAEVVPAYKGISYERLEEGGVQWPCLGPDCPGTAILHRDGFARGKGAFAAVEKGVAATVTGVDFSLVLLTGSVREHHGSGVRSRRAPGLTKILAEARLQVSPGDGKRLGVASGDKVRMVVHDGTVITVVAQITSVVPDGVVFLPGFSPEAPVTRLLGREGSAAPAVSVERL